MGMCSATKTKATGAANLIQKLFVVLRGHMNALMHIMQTLKDAIRRSREDAICKWRREFPLFFAVG